MAGELLDPIAVIFGDEDLVGAILLHGIAVQSACCVSGHVDIVIGIRGNRGGNGISTRYPQLLGVKSHATAAVFGEVEIVSAGQGIAVQSAFGRSCHVNIAAAIGGKSVAEGDLICRAELLGADPSRRRRGGDHPVKPLPGILDRRGVQPECRCAPLDEDLVCHDGPPTIPRKVARRFDRPMTRICLRESQARVGGNGGGRWLLGTEKRKSTEQRSKGD